MDRLADILAALAVAIPAAGAAPARILGRDRSWRVTMAAAAAAVVVTVAAMWAFYGGDARAGEAYATGLAPRAFGVDEISIVLLPFAAVVFALAVLVVPRAQRSAGFCARVLASEAVVLAMFCCSDAQWLAPLWLASLVPAYLETRAAADAHADITRVVLWYLGASAALFFAGTATAAAFSRLAMPFWTSHMVAFFSRSTPRESGPRKASMPSSPSASLRKPSSTLK